MLDIFQFWTHADSWTQLLIMAGLKGTLLLSLGFGAAYILRRNSASLRHLSWSLVLTSLLLLPFLSLAAPAWPLAVLPQAPDDASRAHYQLTNSSIHSDQAGLESSDAFQSARPDASRGAASSTASRVEPLMPLMPGQVPSSLQLNVPQALLSLWLAGVLLAVGRLLLAAALLRRELALAQKPRDEDWRDLLEQVRHRLGLKRQVRLRLGRSEQMPLVWGLLRPVVLLPAQARGWSQQERRAVLLHEVAHIKRHDLLVQFVASLACALYWFNPLAWMAAKAVRREREQACDDLVLRCGTRPSTYARQLLTLAQRMKGARMVSAASLAMSRPSELEGRLLSILNGKQNRGAASPRVMLALAALILLAAVPLAALTPVSQEASAEQSQGQAQEQAASAQAGVSSGQAAAAQSASGGTAVVAGVGSGRSAAARGASSGRAGVGVGLGGAVVGSGASQSEPGISVAGESSLAAQSSAYQSQDHQETNPGDRSGNISLSERDGTRWRIEMEGLQVDQDYALKGFKDNGYLRIEVRREGRSEDLLVEPDGSGGLRRTYRVEGRQVDDPEAAEELLGEGMERIRRTDASHAEARRQVARAQRQVEETRLQVQEHQRSLRAAEVRLRGQQVLRERELAAMAREAQEQMRQVRQNSLLEDGQYRQALKEIEETVRALRETVPQVNHVSQEVSRQALQETLAAQRQALQLGQVQLARQMAEASERLHSELTEARQGHGFAMERMQALRQQLEAELQTGLAGQMDDLHQAMDSLHKEMDHLRDILEAARSQIESTLRQELEPHDLGWDFSRLERSIEDLASQLLNLGNLNEEDGRFHFTAPRGEIQSLLNEALADPLDRLDDASRASLRQSLDRLADQLSDLRW